MSTLAHSIVTNCPNCGSDLQIETLVCPKCNALIYRRELDGIANQARAHEANGEFAQAKDVWNQSLALLPPGSTQSNWVRERIRALESPDPAKQISQAASAQKEPIQNQATKNWVKKLGPFGPLALLLLKFKSFFFLLFKLKFLFSFLFYIAIYVSLFGWWFGLGFSVSILIHEMGHFLDIKRRGLPAEMPVFLPGLGAYVRWNSLGVTRRQIAQIALAGPLAGWIAAAVSFLLYARTGSPIWAALARTGAVLNLLNLIPIWILDGGQAVRPLGAVERAALLAGALGLWYYTGEGIFFFVAAGITWSLFAKDKPLESDWPTWAYYAALMTALAVLMHATRHAIPSAGFVNQ